jgi:hypothetical protein
MGSFRARLSVKLLDPGRGASLFADFAVGTLVATSALDRGDLE